MSNKLTKLNGAGPNTRKTNTDAQFANFVPSGLPRFWTHSKIGFRHFAKDYSLPIVVTVAFFLLIIVVVLLRFSQRSNLATLLAGVTGTGQDYGTLLSKDKTDEINKNSDTNQPSRGPADTSTSFAINTGGSTSVKNPTALFDASIAYFRQDSVTLECKTSAHVAKLCSKRYVFGAGISTQNGPGTVNYGWQSSLQSAIEDASIAAASGNKLIPLQKTITLACTDATSFSLRLTLFTPTFTQSAVLNTNHNCNDI